MPSTSLASQASPYSLTEEEKRKQELEADPDFMKFVRLYKVIKVPLANIKQKMKAEGKYKPIDMDLFVDSK